MLSVRQWVFAPLNTHTPEQNQQWWADCFLPTPALDGFVRAEYSSAILGEAGSGRGVALAYLRQMKPTTTLVLTYDLLHWPRGKEPHCPNKGHFHQMMGAVMAYLLEGEWWDKLERGDELVREFFFWAVKTYLPAWRQRPLRAAFGRLDPSYRQLFEQVGELFPDSTNTYAPQLQELKELLFLWGYEQIWLVVQGNTAHPHFYGDLRDLLEIQRLFEQSFLNLRFVLPDEATMRTLLAGVNGRLAIHTLRYRPNQVHEILGRHVRLATQGEIGTVGELATAEVWTQIEQDVRRLYGHTNESYLPLKPFLQWVHTLLEVYQGQKEKEPVAKIEKAAEGFYGRYIPLRLDPERRGVWQGPRFITLSPQPWDVLHMLFLKKGQYLDLELMEIAQSKENLYTLIRRLRRELEPPLLPTRKPLYLKSDSRGYCLDID